MTNHQCKVIVAGGGPAGLSAAILMVQAGFDTLCLAPPAQDDPRTVALMAPSLKLLENAGVWPGKLSEVSAPLKQLHIIDDTGNLVSSPPLRFAAGEINLDCFGWNIPLTHLIPALRTEAERIGVRFLASKATAAKAHGKMVTVTLEDGDTIEAGVAIAADGAQSVLRQSAGITCESWSFDQDALVLNFDHSAPHEGVSTEWHKKGGPFTTVPLPGNRSALVWMNKPAEAARLAALSPAEMAVEIQLQGHGTLGKISNVTPARRFAMRGIRAMRYAANRTYLIGEAAHVFPPIGAQGLNMSLRDAGHAADMITGHDDPGSEAAMAEYHALRLADVRPRQFAVGMMNWTLLSEFAGLDLLRVAGLSAVSALPPLRNLAMRESLAPSRNLPFAMR